jgi:hypothetical protein
MAKIMKSWHLCWAGVIGLRQRAASSKPGLTNANRNTGVLPESASSIFWVSRSKELK